MGLSIHRNKHLQYHPSMKDVWQLHHESHKVQFETERVKTVDTFKYLGIMLDRNLRFDAYVTYLRRKVYMRLKALGKVRQHVSRNLAVQVYESLVLPHLDYADVIYDAMLAQSEKQLQT